MSVVAELRRMSYPKLTETLAKAEKIKAEKEREERAKVKLELADFAKSKGFSLEEIISAAGRRPAKRANPPKYRNPSNPKETWTGQGRPPKWFDKEHAVSA